MNILTKLKTAELSNFLDHTSFHQLGLSNDAHIKFQKSLNGFSDHKGPENINYTMVKYGETLVNFL